MSRGHPDWFAIPTFKRYGTGQVETYSGIISGPAQETIITIAGKGILYGGHVNVDSTADSENHLTTFYADDQAMMGITWKSMRTFDYDIPAGPNFCLTCFNEEDWKYAMVFGGGLSFETKLEMKYFVTNALSPAVYAAVFFALIT